MPQHTLPSRILVGISCEPDATGIAISRADRHAFLQAAWIAQRVGGVVRAFHVTDFVDARVAGPAERLRGVLRESLNAQVEAMCDKATVNRVVTSHGFAEGKPWFELLREAHRWQADLIVVSPRRSQLGLGARILHGSTARRLIRKAAVPVLVVHAGPDVGFQHVLALVDGSPVSELVMRNAQAFADLGGAQRTALRCLDFPEDIALRRLPRAEDVLRAYHNEVRGLAEAELSALANATAPGWKLALDDRYIIDAVPRRVDEESIDLVVLATTSRPRVAGVLLGTTAERILEVTTASTLVVRPPDWQSPVRFEE